MYVKLTVIMDSLTLRLPSIDGYFFDTKGGSTIMLQIINKKALPLHSMETTMTQLKALVCRKE